MIGPPLPPSMKSTEEEEEIGPPLPPGMKISTATADSDDDEAEEDEDVSTYVLNKYNYFSFIACIRQLDLVGF